MLLILFSIEASHLIAKNMSGVDKVIYLHEWYRWMRTFSKNHNIQDPPISALGKNNYIEIIGWRYRNLEFDYYTLYILNSHRLFRDLLKNYYS